MDFKKLKSTKLKFLIGTVFSGLLIFSSISAIFTEGKPLTSLIIAFLMVWLTFFLKKKHDYYSVLLNKAESYYVLVSNNRETPISDIANYTSDSENTVIEVFEELIKKQVTENYAINLQRRAIINTSKPIDEIKVTIKTEVEKVNPIRKSKKNVQKQNRSKISNIKCTQCGAMNSIETGKEN